MDVSSVIIWPMRQVEIWKCYILWWKRFVPAYMCFWDRSLKRSFLGKPHETSIKLKLVDSQSGQTSTEPHYESFTTISLLNTQSLSIKCVTRAVLTDTQLCSQARKKNQVTEFWATWSGRRLHACGRGIENRWFIRFLPTQSQRWFNVELLSASTSSCSFTSLPVDRENFVLSATNATWMGIMARRRRKAREMKGHLEQILAWEMGKREI